MFRVEKNSFESMSNSSYRNLKIINRYTLIYIVQNQKILYIKDKFHRTSQSIFNLLIIHAKAYINQANEKLESIYGLLSN